jgi:transposase
MPAAGESGLGSGVTKEVEMVDLRLGIDVACRAAHRASLADDRGEFIWSGWGFHTRPEELDRLWEKIPDGADVTVVMEPTRNAWVPLASWLRARGAEVVLVPPEQSADLRDYYNKHTKTDRLDSRVLARLPLLHPEGLIPEHGSGAADPLKRAVRQRSSMLKRRIAAMQRLDAYVELLGPAWADALGSGDYGKAALAVLERWADPRAVKRAGQKRIATRMIRVSRGGWREDRADRLLAAADESLRLWAHGGIDFAELSEDIAAEVRVINALNTEIANLDERIEVLYAQADPDGIVVSAPGLGVTSAAGILGRIGDMGRFDNLSGIRAFTGMVPKVDQSGLSDNPHHGITKKGDPGLRQAIFLAADAARKVDPTLAARYHRLMTTGGKHHVSAVCAVGTVLITRIAACWRNGEHYVLQDVDGRQISETEGRAICHDHYRVDTATRTARRTTRRAQTLKRRTSRRKKESTEAAPTSDPSTSNDIENLTKTA